MAVTDQDRAAIRKLYRKIRLELRPLVEAEAQRLNHDRPHTLNLMAAQNTMRSVFEIVLQECLPYDQTFLTELAVRAAAYLISAAPVEDHEPMVEAARGALAHALAEKVRQGAVIKTTWLVDGGERSNIPSGVEVN